ncbi:MAG TPA: hypothetical protein ENL03_05265 [Phycisphaerae bacterium]|nr:hypothetical protein [Phycisphaerae bacterium]
MKMTCRILVVALLAVAGFSAGCSKQITVTVYNHGASARDIKITVPQGTMNVGSASPDGGRIVRTLKIKNENLPAQCNLSAGFGASQSFTVDELTRDKLWFHISKDGAITGPLDKDSTHVETSDPDVIRLKSPQRMIVD